MSKQTPGAKPPTQVASVAGIAPKPVTMNDTTAEGRTRVDMRALVQLPPFQMFAVERTYLSQGEIEMLTGLQGPNAMRVMQNLVFRAGNDINALYDDYRQWHAEKGCWPDEDPLGNLASNASLIADEGRAS